MARSAAGLQAGAGDRIGDVSFSFIRRVILTGDKLIEQSFTSEGQNGLRLFLDVRSRTYGQPIGSPVPDAPARVVRCASPGTTLMPSPVRGELKGQSGKLVVQPFTQRIEIGHSRWTKTQRLANDLLVPLSLAAVWLVNGE